MINYKYNKKETGSIAILSTLFFLVISFSIITVITGPSIANYKISREFLSNTKNYHLVESVAEEFVYRIKKDGELDDNILFEFANKIFIINIENFESQKILTITIQGETEPSKIVTLDYLF